MKNKSRINDTNILGICFYNFYTYILVFEIQSLQKTKQNI